MCLIIKRNTEMEQIIPQAIINADVPTQAPKPKTYQKILSELSAQIKPIDFRATAKVDESKSISRKNYVVIAIDEINKVATANNWGLCTKNRFVYVFNGEFWQTVNDGDFKIFLSDVSLKMGVPELECKYFKFKDELYQQFISASNLPELEPGDKVLINLLNGTFEITAEKQERRDFRRDDFLKYQLPFEYNPNAKYPMFHKFIDRVLPDGDCQRLLSEYLGYVFTNNLKLEKAAILYGDGANGKSVLFDIVNAILGHDNICSYSIQDITQSNSYQCAELENKLLNYDSEINANGKVERARFKQLISGETIGVRQIYGKPYVISRYAKLMFNCNELPKDTEQTNAFFRRFLIFPFSVEIPEAEQDTELSKKIIKNELSGVFNWILEGLKRILANKKFSPCKLVEEQLSEYKKESDTVAMFIDDENYSTDTTDTITLKKLYSDYRKYCYDCGNQYPCQNKTFAKRLRKLRYKVEKCGGDTVVYMTKKLSF
jgi:putative DNA primase/helicase